MLIFFSRTYSSEQWPHSHDGVWDYPGWKHVHCWHWVCHQLCILAKLAGLVKGKVVLKKSNVLFQYYIHIYIYKWRHVSTIIDYIYIQCCIKFRGAPKMSLLMWRAPQTHQNWPQDSLLRFHLRQCSCDIRTGLGLGLVR